MHVSPKIFRTTQRGAERRTRNDTVSRCIHHHQQCKLHPLTGSKLLGGRRFDNLKRLCRLLYRIQLINCDKGNIYIETKSYHFLFCLKYVKPFFFFLG